MVKESRKIEYLVVAGSFFEGIKDNCSRSIMYGTGDAYIFVFIESGCRIWSGFNWGEFPIIYQRYQISLLVSTMAWPLPVAVSMMFRVLVALKSFL